ncbi:MAG: RtcB family protein [Solobacterium sp.]|nr:RtcB family protein [Solobacterium sp.]
MIEIKGDYAEAKVFTDDIEEQALAQIRELLDQPFAKDSHPRFMPDVHAGKGCTIGTTMHITDRACPNLVGVDIGCGMLVVPLKETIDDFEKLDAVIHRYVPAGMSAHEKAVIDYDISGLKCFGSLKNREYLICSLGTLGGGNHFIEIDRADDGSEYLVIHTGSRNLGKQVCEIYMEKAHEKMAYGKTALHEAGEQLILKLKEEGRSGEIAGALKDLKNEYKRRFSERKPDLAVLEGGDLEDYLHDMKLSQEFAKTNREMIADIILHAYFGSRLQEYDFWHCIHNYIDTDKRILRKGAISAEKGENVIIPLNMRDGCILGKGKGNPDWNCSGPHGAGRKMSRSAAVKNLSMEDFRQSMEGIFSSTVVESVIDEAPAAYKDSAGIIGNIAENIEIIQIIRPVYNFKAAG